MAFVALRSSVIDGESYEKTVVPAEVRLGPRFGAIGRSRGTLVIFKIQPRYTMTKPKAPPQPRSTSIDPNPKGELKRIGGSLADEWNLRLLNLVGGSLPIDHSDRETSNEAIKAVIQATADIAPADPIEGILIAQLMAANEAALAMYRKGWAQPPEYFRGADEISAACRQGGPDGHDVDRKARPPPRPRAATDHRQACDHEQRHSRPGDNCR